MTGKEPLIFVLPSLSRGGAERVAVTLMPELMRAFDVTVVLLERRLGYDLPDKTALVALSEKLAGSAAHILRIPYHLAALARLIRKKRAAIVLSFMEQANILNLIASFWTRHKTVIVEHTVPRRQFGPERGILGRLIMEAARLTYRKADHIITVSEGIKQALLADFKPAPDRVTVIPNPVDAKTILSLAEEEPPFPLPKNFLLHVGRLTINQKGQDILLETFSLLRRRYGGLKLILVGDGPDRPVLEALVRKLGLREQVILAGARSNVFAFMARARMLILCSRYEGGPMVITEAMTCGCPVVATDCPTGPRELLGASEFGILVSERSPLALAAAIGRLLDDEELHRHYREQAIRRAREHDVARIGPRYVSLIRKYGDTSLISRLL